MKGEGNQQDYGKRIYDSRLGRFLSADPLIIKYPFYSSYQFSGNDVIRCIDLDGGEPLSRTEKWDRNTAFISGTNYNFVYDKASNRMFDLQGVVDPSNGKLWIVGEDGQGQQQYFYLVNDDGATDKLRTYVDNGRTTLYKSHLESFETRNEIDAKQGAEIADAISLAIFGVAAGVTAAPAISTVGGAPLVGSGSVTLPATAEALKLAVVKGLASAGADVLTQLTLNDNNQPLNGYSIGANFVGGFLNLNAFTTAAGASVTQYNSKTGEFELPSTQNFIINTTINGAFGSLTGAKKAPWNSANFSSKGEKLAVEAMATIPGYWGNAAGSAAANSATESKEEPKK